MNTDNEATQMDMRAETPAPQKSKIPKAAWYVGGGCLALLCCAAMVALAVAGYFYFFSSKDIATVVPNSSMMYVSVDFLQTQSDQFNKIVPIFQGIAGAEKKPLLDAVEETLKNELDLSFKNEVMPWMGQHGAFVITDGDIQSQDFEFMFIVEARDTKLADAFLPKFAAALENKRSIKFEKKDVNGVTFYSYVSGSGRKNDMVIARSGSFVYLANAEAPVISSINLKSADSLASSAKYKEAMGALPKNGISFLYVNGESISKYAANLSGQLATPPTTQVANDSISGVGITMSLEDAGLRFDAAIAYDQSKLNDFQKESLKATYAAPKTAALVPENTFFFFGVNSSQTPAKTLQENNPIYTQDFKEALDLLEKQYNVSLKELFAMLTGEFSIAVGPSNDGFLATQAKVNLGITMFAGTDNEAGFNGWAKNALDAASQNIGAQFSTTDATVGGYKLKQATVEGVNGELLFYGADKGYIILGTSQDILEKGLGGSGALADNAAYKNTWKAFPSKSVPYIYVNLSGILDFYKNMPGGNNLGAAEEDWKKIPIIAASMNPNSGYVSGMTLIVFINTK